jgi:hypothetical protein
VDADEELLHRVKVGVIVFTEDRHKSITKAAQAWGRDTSATDKALRNCVQGTALGVIENIGMKRRQRLDAFTEVSTAAFSGYVLGRELLGTETARPSYSSCDVEEKNNAVRIHERSQAWPSDTLIEAFTTSELLMHVIHSLAKSLVFREIVGARRTKAILLKHVVGSVAFAMAEDDLFGPFIADSP